MINFAIWLSGTQAENYTPQDKTTEEHKPKTPNCGTALPCIGDLHINVWKNELESCIDFGLMLPNKGVREKKLNIYIPSKEVDLTLTDLNSILIGSQRVLNAVFNEIVKTESCHESPLSKLVRYSKKNEKFCLLGLTQNRINKICAVNGTIYIIDLSTDCGCKCECEYIYLRFRIKGKFICDAFCRDELATSKLQNFTSEISVFDIRINEIRALPNDIVDTLQGKKTVKFRTIQFFLMCSSEEDLLLSKMPHRSVRCLEREDEAWGIYYPPLAGVKKKELIFAYQWKKETCVEMPLDDFTLLVKIRKDKLLPRKVSMALIMTFLFAVIASLFASTIFSCSSDLLRKQNVSEQQRVEAPRGEVDGNSYL